MVRMTSHDLKNPLQAAMANLELLQDELTDADIHNSEIDDSITQIDKQLSRMNRIIRGILDLERVKIGARNFDDCPPAQIVDRAFRRNGRARHRPPHPTRRRCPAGLACARLRS